MSTRSTLGRFLLGLALAAGASACAPTVRHGVLTFFFDGVPEPGAEPTVGYPVESQPMVGPAGREAATGPRARTVHYAHPPYRENRCGTCHNVQDGQLQRSPEEGLCLTCHSELAREPTFLHGPVAVNACTFCHHHHTSIYPQLLLEDPATICFGCHEEDDLTTGPHHEERSTQPCLQCHDPHGGSDRFFLRPNQP